MSDFSIPFPVYSRKHKKKYEALYLALRDKIRDGSFPAGMQLPSTRELAQRYRLSRGTVLLAYDMLWGDGYLEGKRGSGTYVALGKAELKSLQRTSPSISLSPWGRRVSTSKRTPDPLLAPRGTISFGLGVPDGRSFPLSRFGQCLRESVREFDSLASPSFIPTEGLPMLREQIAKHLRETRGIDADDRNVVVVNGSAQAIALLFHLLVGEKTRVVVENPSYTGTRDAILAAGGAILPADVDDNGITISDWNAPLAFVTPGHQYPTGVALSAARRHELLEWANRRNAFIIEDDFDCEFRRRGRPLEPLRVLDGGVRVITIGTFSKTVSTSLRLGYALLPESLRDEFIAAKRLFEPLASGVVEQGALSLFMKRGWYRSHLTRMKRVYAQKHETFLLLINQALPDAAEWTESEIGLHCFGWWRRSKQALTEFRQGCQSDGLVWEDPSPMFVSHPRPALLWGFSHLSESQMKRGLQIAARHLPRVLTK